MVQLTGEQDVKQKEAEDRGGMRQFKRFQQSITQMTDSGDRCIHLANSKGEDAICSRLCLYGRLARLVSSSLGLALTLCVRVCEWMLPFFMNVGIWWKHEAV
jgi:hypothetical protein